MVTELEPEASMELSVDSDSLEAPSGGSAAAAVGAGGALALGPPRVAERSPRGR